MTPARAADALAGAAAALARVSGWRRLVAAFAAGIAAALAQAPFYILPMMAAGYSLLLLLIDAIGAQDGSPARRMRAAFATGWAFGFGYFLVGLYWLGYAFMVQAEQFAWMAPIAITGLPAFLALFFGAACAGYVRVAPRGARRILAFAAIVMVFEYARGHILTGLPWNLPGQAFAGTAIGAQTAAFWGVYGLSLVALVLATLPAAFAGQGRGAQIKGAVAALLGAGALFAVGAARLALVDPGDRDDYFVRIVQPNIPQAEKIDPDLWSRNLERHIALSEAPIAGPTIILWPENAAPVIDEVPSALTALSARLPKNAVLVTGAVRRAPDASGAERYYNAIAVIPETPAGRVAAARYDKHHLVPFGEYLPLNGVLRAIGLSQLAPFEEGFTPGAGPAVIAGFGPPFAALVCYEVIFPGRMYPRGERPEWIATVTNDGWYGNSSGPRQHLDQARLRAIETGLPMARSGHNGISAVFDAAGRTRARLALDTAGVIDRKLPKAAPPTLYQRAGDFVFWLMMAAAAAATVIPRRIGPRL
ncbi:MAG: apolipoprotein N-acyltransferase [Parvularculaceae bacterium]